MVQFGVSRYTEAELYIDVTSALELAKVIDAISPRPITVQYLYMHYHNTCDKNRDHDWTEQSNIGRLIPMILKPVKSSGGQQMFCIRRDEFLQQVEKDEVSWTVLYQPAELYNEYLRAVDELQREQYQALQPLMSQYNGPEMHGLPLNSFSPMTQGINYGASGYSMPSTATAPMSFAGPSVVDLQVPQPAAHTHTQSIAQSMDMINESSPATTIMQRLMQSVNTPSNISSSTLTPSIVEVAMQGVNVHSGYPSPTTVIASPREEERGPVQSVIDAMVSTIGTPRGNSPRARTVFPTSQFAIADIESKEDEKAAHTIVNLLKVLAIDLTPQTKNRFSIQKEKKAIKSMSIDTSLNIGTQERKMGETLDCLFSRYDKKDPNGQESFQRALLIVAVRLLRQRFVNETGKKGPGNYAGDFDALYPFSSRFIPQGAILCRMIVSCGQPCILIVLVRMAIRNKICIGKLLDELPLQHFCRFIASGKVTDCNSSSNKTTIHDNLSWLHTNVFLPLLHAASKRVPSSLCMLDASIDCDEDTCLRAIVHHTQQVKYGNFLLGHFIDEDWKRGRVLLEGRSYDKSSKAEYSIEKKKRTIHHYTLETYSNVEHFRDPPDFLLSKVLAMQTD